MSRPSRSTAFQESVRGRVGELPAGEFNEIAALVAGGEIPFPADLPEAETELLAQMVQQLRRERLIRFFARVIARDLLRESGT